MPLRIKIDDGGTHAGHRTITEPKLNWRCSQGHQNLGRNLRCMTAGCNEKRP